MKKNVLLDALAGKNESTPPIWLMRQAGRYLSSYQALRKKYSFEELCMTPELAAHVTMLPLNRFDVDAAIIFSDILFPLKVLGATPLFPEEGGPKLVYNTLRFPKNIKEELRTSLSPVYQAIALVKRASVKPLIGFSGAPWTLFAYLIEKGRSFSWKTALKCLEDDSFQEIFSYLDQLVQAHLELQIEAGCDVVQIFDSLAPMLSKNLLGKYSFSPLEKMSAALPHVPKIFFRVHQEYLPFFEKKSSCALSLDVQTDLAQVRKSFPTYTLQGNLDPLLLCQDASSLKRAASHMCTAMKNDPAFICNVGQGLLPQTKEDLVQVLIDTVREI
jgi:uroporphyrinogen decarboxylase